MIIFDHLRFKIDLKIILKNSSLHEVSQQIRLKYQWVNQLS